jgi:hypothetical protein
LNIHIIKETTPAKSSASIGSENPVSWYLSGGKIINNRGFFAETEVETKSAVTNNI